MNIKNKKPIWHGVMLVAGGAIGAGMFALPLVASGTWFINSAIGLLFVFGFTYLSASLLVDVNSTYPEGSSFDTLVRNVLGAKWAALNNLSVSFILFILMYAYITAGAGILERSVVEPLLASSDISVIVPRELLTALFTLFIALFIAFGTVSVSRLSGILMVGMCLSFVTANFGILSSLNFDSLGHQAGSDISYLWSALPVFVTAFACAGLVPSLNDYYRRDVLAVKRVVFCGLLLALSVYLIWLASTLGSVSRSGFIDVEANGGGLSALVHALQGKADNSWIQYSLNWFSNFAVITSFLSVGLGLVHFLIDQFNLKKQTFATTRAVLLAFLPTLLASIIAPYGFVTAISYAGVFVALSFFILPALIYRRANERAKLCSKIGIAWSSVLIFGFLIISLKVATIFDLLPSYP